MLSAIVTCELCGGSFSSTDGYPVCGKCERTWPRCHGCGDYAADRDGDRLCSACRAIHTCDECGEVFPTPVPLDVDDARRCGDCRYNLIRDAKHPKGKWERMEPSLQGAVRIALAMEWAWVCRHLMRQSSAMWQAEAARIHAAYVYLFGVEPPLPEGVEPPCLSAR